MTPIATTIHEQQAPRRSAPGTVRATFGAVLTLILVAAGLASTTSNPASAATPAPAAPSAATAVTAGGEHACVLSGAGSVSCWGDRAAAPTGSPFATKVPPTPIPGFSGVTAIVAGDYSTCGLFAGGAVKCIGDNQYGQLGDGTTTDRAVVTGVPGLTGVTKLALTTAIVGDRVEEHTCALLTNTTVRCWGDNFYGQLGDSSTTDRLTPTPVTGLSGVTGISVSYRRSCALLADTTVKCWGTDVNGTVLVPTTVPNLSGVTSLVIGEYHACALLAGGSVKCWGSSNFGQIGDGSHFTLRPTPVAVTGVTDAVAISAGPVHNCVVLAGGTVKCWGINSLGESGIPMHNTDVTAPLTVDGLTGVTQLSAGSRHSCAVLATGGVKCWGVNDLGQLGDPALLDLSHAAPVNVVGLTTGAPSVALAALPAVSKSTSVAVRWDGTGWTGIGHFDVRRRDTVWNGSLGTWKVWRPGTPARSAAFVGAVGHTYCFSVRAQDAAGHLSGWTGKRCTTVPLRSDQLAYSAGWVKVTDAGAYAGYGYRTATPGATVTRTRLVAQKVSLVVRKCPTCGTVEVRWNGALRATVNLANAKTVRKQVVNAFSLTGAAQTGTLTITYVGPTGKYVLIEGVAGIQT